MKLWKGETYTRIEIANDDGLAARLHIGPTGVDYYAPRCQNPTHSLTFKQLINLINKDLNDPEN